MSPVCGIFFNRMRGPGYNIPVVTNSYVGEALRKKGLEVKRTWSRWVASTLQQDSQALWVALHHSLAHKLDYHLSLCYIKL